MKPTEASKAGKGYVAANGSKIANYGEKKVLGFTDDWTGISMNTQCADARKTLASVHRMNQGGNAVMLDGKDSYLVNKATGKKTKIEYEDGQYVMYVWVKTRAATETDKQTVKARNRYAALTVEDDGEMPGFTRRAQKA